MLVLEGSQKSRETPEIEIGVRKKYKTWAADDCEKAIWSAEA